MPYIIIAINEVFIWELSRVIFLCSLGTPRSDKLYLCRARLRPLRIFLTKQACVHRLVKWELPSKFGFSIRNSGLEIGLLPFGNSRVTDKLC